MIAGVLWNHTTETTDRLLLLLQDANLSDVLMDRAVMNEVGQAEGTQWGRQMHTLGRARLNMAS